MRTRTETNERSAIYVRETLAQIQGAIIAKLRRGIPNESQELIRTVFHKCVMRGITIIQSNGFTLTIPPDKFFDVMWSMTLAMSDRDLDPQSNQDEKLDFIIKKYPALRKEMDHLRSWINLHKN